MGGFVILIYSGKATFDLEASVAVLALVISLSTILISFIDSTNDRLFSTKKSINISVEVRNNMVICWGSVSNSGRKRILNKNVYLVISKGQLKDGAYEFGLPLEHEDDDGKISSLESYCIYSKLMHNCFIEDCSKCIDNRDMITKTEGLDKKGLKLIDRFNRQVNQIEYHRIFVFKGLSKASRLFVDSGEDFSDEIVLNLDPGVYRALMIWIPEGKEDCACSLKYFKI